VEALESIAVGEAHMMKALTLTLTLTLTLMEAHMMGVAREGGRLLTWGTGSYGVLGHGKEASPTYPKLYQSTNNLPKALPEY